MTSKIQKLCKKGQVWQLGTHRLMCGDSTNATQIEAFLGNKKASMIFTDPPYGVDYTSKNKLLNEMGKGIRNTKPIKNDNLKGQKLQAFWSNVFKHIPLVLKEDGTFYICSASGADLSYRLVSSLNEHGIKARHNIVWNKNGHVLGRGDYNYKHELIVYGWMKKHHFYGNGSQFNSVWDYAKPQKADLHPTMKPVDLIKNAILNSSDYKEIVFDFFLGSGSTLIACEETNRKCYGIEIDPRYCDVIINRWEKFTNNKAKLVK